MNPGKMIKKIIPVLLITILTACYYDSEERLYPKLSSPCDDVNVTFSSTVVTILKPCQTCHSNSAATSSGSGIKLQNYVDVQALAKTGKLIGVIKHSAGYVSMPPGGSKLPDCEISQLQKWIDNGTLNN